jgi:alpha-L-rhamnosidase
MNSFNHYAFGAVGEWLYATVGGISVDHTADATITIHPRPGAGIEWARATYPSVHGDVACSWSLTDGVLTVDATVPVGGTTEIWLPAGADATATPDDPDGLTRLPRRDDAVGFRAASGVYRFVVR